MLPHGWLFPGRGSVEPISMRQVNPAVHEARGRRWSPEAGDVPYAAPQLRYHLLEQDVDIRVIQVLLGHAKLDTTALYAWVAAKTIRAVTSPLERLALRMEGASPAG